MTEIPEMEVPEAMSKLSNRAWFWLLQCTWGIIQTLIGFIIVIVQVCRNKCSFKVFRCAVVCSQKDGPSSGYIATFGPFINYFMGYSENEVVHEYGHCIQSIILGPLWLLVIGLPSLLWCVLGDEYREKHDYDYYDFYTEKWATALGEYCVNKGDVD